MDHDYLKHYTVKETDNILELGAFCGEFTETLSNKCPRGTVMTLEPSPWAIARLAGVVNTCHGHVQLMSGVCGSYDGYAALEMRNSGVLNSVFHKPAISQDFGRDAKTVFRQKVASYTPKSLARYASLPEFDFVCCDVEGSEMEVFTEESLRYFKAGAIAAYHIRDGKQTHEALLPLFLAHGYKAFVEDSGGSVLYFERMQGPIALGSLANDAEQGRCSKCLRRTWTIELGQRCGMTKPDGSKCAGVFVPPDAVHSGSE